MVKVWLDGVAAPETAAKLKLDGVKTMFAGVAWSTVYATFTLWDTLNGLLIVTKQLNVPALEGASTFTKAEVELPPAKVPEEGVMWHQG
jgi:hypothetical protein